MAFMKQLFERCYASVEFGNSLNRVSNYVHSYRAWALRDGGVGIANSPVRDAHDFAMTTDSEVCEYFDFIIEEMRNTSVEALYDYIDARIGYYRDNVSLSYVGIEVNEIGVPWSRSSPRGSSPG